jgi:hypothetical protein
MNLFSIGQKLEDKVKLNFNKKKPVFPSKVPNSAVAYGVLGPTQSRTSFQVAEYNLGEISKVMDIESYVRQAFNKHVELCLKEGYDITSRNQEATLYIKRRLREMAEVSDLTFDMLLRYVTQNVVAYSNAFLVKVRDYKRSSGRAVPRVNGPSLPPVAAYFPMDPTSIRVKRDFHGKILKYWQRVPGNPIMPQFIPENVVHFYYDKKEGFAFGTPYIVPVLDDIRSLRRMEENVEMLVTQHLFPLFHYIVGTETAPAEVYDDGTSEVDVIKEQIERMPTEGSIVTPERHSIEALGSEGKALDASVYLKYFEKRVLAGLGMSELALGRGDTSNRSCYSEDTETLTDHGWKMYWDIHDNDRIATFNPEKNSIEFHYPNDGIHLHSYNGKMFHFKNSLVDVLVTPDHDMWIGSSLMNNRGATWKKQKADKIKVKRFKFKTGGLTWEGDDIEYFKLPFVPYKSNIHFENSVDFGKIKIEDWVEFLGYYVSEGTLAKVKNVWPISISQSNKINSDKVQKIRECLERLPFKFNEYIDKNDDVTRFWINCKSLYLYLQEICGDYSYRKKFPEETLSYSTNLLKIMFDAAIMGDGSIANNNGFCHRTYYSTSEVLIGQMQEIALKLGYRSNIIPGSGCFRLLISECDMSEVRRQEDLSIIDYNGKVYCFNIPNHLFITRRNGKIGIHGNTSVTIDKVMTDRCKDFQSVIEGVVNEFIFKELLLEGGYSIDETEDNFVKLRFREIDIDFMLKVQNHAVFKYEHHAVTETEMREEISRDPISDEQREGLYLETVQLPVEEQAAKLKAEFSPSLGGAASSSSPKLKKKSTENREKPTNQHGQKPAKTVEKKDLFLANFDYLWGLTRVDFIDLFKDEEDWRGISKDRLNSIVKITLEDVEKTVSGFNINYGVIKNDIERLFSDLEDMVSDTISRVDVRGDVCFKISGIFESLRFRLSILADKIFVSKEGF